jgi:hypothetical protein
MTNRLQWLKHPDEMVFEGYVAVVSTKTGNLDIEKLEICSNFDKTKWSLALLTKDLDMELRVVLVSGLKSKKEAKARGQAVFAALFGDLEETPVYDEGVVVLEDPEDGDVVVHTAQLGKVVGVTSLGTAVVEFADNPGEVYVPGNNSELILVQAAGA